MSNSEPVSFIVPAYNAESTIGATLASLIGQEYEGPIEIIVVDDGSSDGTANVVRGFPSVKLVSVANGGAARAINTGVKSARHEIVITVDSDATLAVDWLQHIVPWFSDMRVGAVAGYIRTGRTGIIGRVAGYWSEYRHRSLSGKVNNLGGANTAYRRDALMAAGMFDESFRHGHDVAMSRSLVHNGWALVRETRAVCTHFWRSTLRGYLRQQSGYAFYRCKLWRTFGAARNDGVGGALFAKFGVGMGVAASAALAGFWYPQALIGLVALPLLHIPEAVGIARVSREVRVAAASLLVLTLRDFAWLWGIARYASGVLVRQCTRTKRLAGFS